MDINGLRVRVGGGERETDGNDEKAEKITHQDEKRWRYKGFKVKGG